MAKLWKFALLSLLLTSGGCDQANASRTPAEGQSTNSQTQKRLWKPAGQLFPAATSLKMFVQNGRNARGEATFSTPNGIVLDEQVRADFEATLFIAPMPAGIDGCFLPHHFFRYFNSKGHQVGEISVCFCCEGVRLQPRSLDIGKDNWLEADYEKLKLLVRKQGQRTDFECGYQE